MLVHLGVRNFALIDRLALEVPPGFVVLTGETGAGKSITFDALAMLLGGRARADVIRSGEDEAVVEALFEVTDAARDVVREVLDAAGLEPTDEVLVRRVISRSGRNRVFVNDAVSTVATLERLVPPLLDLIGQHQHLTLTRADAQRDLIDAAGGLGDEVQAMADAWGALRAARAELAGLEEARAQRAERIEYLRFQLAELDALALEPGEFDALEAKLGRARNLDKLRESVRRAAGALTESNRAASVSLGEAVEALRRASAIDPELGDLAARVDELSVLVDDLGVDLARHARDLDDDVDLDALESRHEAVRKLMRRFAVDDEGLIERHTEMRDELSRLENFEASHEGAQRAVKTAEATAREVADRLHALRREAAKGLFTRAAEPLAALGMPAARLELSDPPADARPGPHGYEGFEIRFGANPGEPAGPIGRVASGGELSRLLLSLKTALLDADPTDTLVFDEIDTGIGGPTGEVLGRLLSDLGDGRQVLCVTHLPQVAAFGDAHFAVSKRTEGDRTVSRLTRLDDRARLEELARMLGSVEADGVPLDHARHLLDRARRSSRT